MRLDAGEFVGVSLRFSFKSAFQWPESSNDCKPSRWGLSTGVSKAGLGNASASRFEWSILGSSTCISSCRSSALATASSKGTRGRMNRRTTTIPRITNSTSRTERPIVVSRLILSFISMPPCRDLENRRARSPAFRRQATDTAEHEYMVSGRDYERYGVGGSDLSHSGERCKRQPHGHLLSHPIATPKRGRPEPIQTSISNR